MQELARRGRDVDLYRNGEPIDPGLAVVFDAWTLFPSLSKPSESDALVNLALALKQGGARILLDNCDNQFAAVAASPDWRAGLERLRRIAGLSDVVISCSVALAEAMRLELGPDKHHVVIDDPIEDQISYPGDSALKALLSPTRNRARLRALKFGLQLLTERARGLTPLVWFGSHGNSFAPGGMLDLLPLREGLEAHDRKHPIALTIISNQRRKFEEHFHGWRFPTHYLEWDRANFLTALKWHEISLIPATDNAFTRCKSSNRLTFSLHHGLAVAAASVPSYRRFAAHVVLDDWSGGLDRLLADPRQRRQTVQDAQAIVRAEFGLPAIASLWERLLFQDV